jgi:hypothetical protein
MFFVELFALQLKQYCLICLPSEATWAKEGHPRRDRGSIFLFSSLQFEQYLIFNYPSVLPDRGKEGGIATPLLATSHAPKEAAPLWNPAQESQSHVRCSLLALRCAGAQIRAIETSPHHLRALRFIRINPDCASRDKSRQILWPALRSSSREAKSEVGRVSCNKAQTMGAPMGRRRIACVTRQIKSGFLKNNWLRQRNNHCLPTTAPAGPVLRSHKPLGEGEVGSIALIAQGGILMEPWAKYQIKKNRAPWA